MQRLSSNTSMAAAGSQDTTLQAKANEGEEDNMEDILSQYMPPQNTTVTTKDKEDSQVTMSNMTDDSALVRAAELEEQKQNPDPDQTREPGKFEG